MTLVDCIPIGTNKFQSINDLIEFLEIEQINQNLPRVLNIVGTVSTFNTIEDFIDSLQIDNFRIDKRYGNLLVISKSIKKETIIYYVFFDAVNQMPLFITDAKKTDEIPNTLFHYINKTSRMGHLWITPKMMKEIKDEFTKKYGKILITYFSAQRSKNTDIFSELRPEFDRNFQYRGVDGSEPLEDLEKRYGVLPKILEVRLPNGVIFKIDNKGVITHRGGEFEDIFNILNNVAKRDEPLREAIQESDYIKSQNGINNKFNYAIQKPWSINLSLGMTIDDIPIFGNSIQTPDWNFTILEKAVIKGSMLFSARIIDNSTGSLIDISTTGKRMDIYPVKYPDIGTSMRFFHFIVENIDNTASIG
ncbi:MAG: hypothetical protein M0Q91_05340 [Methanoregula sp.]|jgi:hypothetical protein|nr:hypothetical protein [Methanoregula sp.]